MAGVYKFKNKLGLFINPPKCATNTIEKVLEPLIVSKITGHITFREVKNNYSDFDDIDFSFATIRNPWERLVSWYMYLRQYRSNSLRVDYNDKKSNTLVKNLPADISFEDFVYNLIENKIYRFGRSEQVFTPQIEYIIGDDKSIKVDYLIDCSNLQHNFYNMTNELGIKLHDREIGLPNMGFPTIRKTEHEHFTEYYKDKEIIELVESWESGILKHHDFVKPEVI